VRKGGFEPPLDCSNQLLRLARLPFRHFRSGVKNPAVPNSEYTPKPDSRSKQDLAYGAAVAAFHRTTTDAVAVLSSF
jgi:hypothetical protein